VPRPRPAVPNPTHGKLTPLLKAAYVNKLKARHCPVSLFLVHPKVSTAKFRNLGEL